MTELRDTGMSPLPTRLTPMAKRTIAVLYSRRHDTPEERQMARAVIRDAQLSLRLWGRKS